MPGALELHGGTIEKYIGDAIMAVFGLPVVREDDALRAVRAAAEMKRRLAVLNDELEAHWGVVLRNRTGVNAGEVESVEPLQLKGKSEAVPAYRLVSVQELGQQERARPRVFVGREAELDRLDAAYNEVVAEGSTRTVTVLAEAGVGKSRLTEEFLGSLRDEPIVLAGRCLPS